MIGRNQKYSLQDKKPLSLPNIHSPTEHILHNNSQSN